MLYWRNLSICNIYFNVLCLVIVKEHCVKCIKVCFHKLNILFFKHVCDTFIPTRGYKYIAYIILLFCHHNVFFSPSKKWEGKLSLEDIDGMFDDLGELTMWFICLIFCRYLRIFIYWSYNLLFFADSSSHDDIISPSPPPQTCNDERSQSDGEISPVTQEGHPTTKLVSQVILWLFTCWQI